jgi:hypothetical protein
MITAVKLQGINFTNVGNALANELNLIVRKRYVGDPNGTLGIRSANMFQTTRSMVFADSLPLHYHLQTNHSNLNNGQLNEVPWNLEQVPLPTSIVPNDVSSDANLSSVSVSRIIGLDKIVEQGLQLGF